MTVNVANTDYFQNEVLATGLRPADHVRVPARRAHAGRELAGRIKVLSPPYTQPDPSPFLQITNIGSAGVQQGIYDLVLDPNFATNHFYYVFYTLGSPNHDRVSRFTANAALTGHRAGQRVRPLRGPAERRRRAPRRRAQLRQRRQAAVHDRRALRSGALAVRSPARAARCTGSTRTGRSRPTTRSTTEPVRTSTASGRAACATRTAPTTTRRPAATTSATSAATIASTADRGDRPRRARAPTTAGPTARARARSPCQSPLFSYPHNGRDAAITGGFVYHGTQFPSSYRGAYFYADYTQNWIRGCRFDANGNVTDTLQLRAVATARPTARTATSSTSPRVPTAPSTTSTSGTPTSAAPSASARSAGSSTCSRTRRRSSHASANPTSGPTPLNVTFSSSGSSDPEGQPLTYSWDFGDGATSTAANPSHTYYDARAPTGAAHGLRRRQRLDLDPDHDQRRQRPDGDDLLTRPTASSSRPAT